MIAGSESYAVCACVSGDGQLDEFIPLHKLATVRLGRAGNFDDVMDSGAQYGGLMHPDKRAKVDDLRRLEEFIEKKRPQLIVVSAENKDALVVMEDLQSILKRLEARNVMGQVPVELVENEIGRLVATSKLCQPDFSTNR